MARWQKIHQSVTILCGSETLQLLYCAKCRCGRSKDKRARIQWGKGESVSSFPQTAHTYCIFEIALLTWNFTCWLIRRKCQWRKKKSLNLNVTFKAFVPNSYSVDKIEMIVLIHYSKKPVKGTTSALFLVYSQVSRGGNWGNNFGWYFCC